MNGMAKSKSCRTLLLAKQTAHSLFQNRFSGLVLDLAHTFAVFLKCFTVWRKICERIDCLQRWDEERQTPRFSYSRTNGSAKFLSLWVNNLFPTLAFIILMIKLTVLMIIPTIILNFDLALQTFMFMSRPMLNSNTLWLGVSVTPHIHLYCRSSLL